MDRIVKLKDVKDGQKVVIQSIDNNLDKKLHKRLLELGVIKNSIVTIIKNSKLTQLMCICVRGCTLSMDYSLAEKIYVYGERL